MTAQVPFDDEAAFLVGQLRPRHVEANLVLARRALQAGELRAIVRLAPRLDRALLDGLAWSGTTRSMSSSMMLPKPWHVGQAPNGLLNENRRGCSVSCAIPHGRHIEAFGERMDAVVVSRQSSVVSRWTVDCRLMTVDFHCPRRSPTLEIRRFDRIGEPLPQIVRLR